MKIFYCCLLLLGVGVFAKERVKRQASYTFPGPRNDRAHRPQSNAAPVYVEEHDDRDSYQAPRRQFQAQPVQPHYAPTQPRSAQPPPPAAPPAAPPPPVYEAPRAAAPAPRQQSAPAGRRRAASSSSRANKYGSAPQQSLNGRDEEEEEQGPDPLTLLLQDSQFSCGEKGDGYYADDSVNCQVFHYCVGGAKHSWMCPENTVFHQVHLNCVPDAQDICSQSQKFHFVNDYLYKPVDYEGPNNTARYSQRYYPDGYVVGDALVAPQEQGPRRPTQHVQSYPPAPAAPRAPPRQSAPAPPPQPTYRAPPQSAPAYNQAPQSRPASRPSSRPSRPVESYPDEAPPQGYRVAPQPQSSPAYRQVQQQQAPRQSPPQQQQAPRQSPPQTYRVISAPAQQDSPASHSGYSSEENLYQPQPQPQPQPQARRPSAPAHQARPTAGYSPPRQQYRPNARSSGGYQSYSPNQAGGAGVQYDEDY